MIYRRCYILMFLTLLLSCISTNNKQEKTIADAYQSGNFMVAESMINEFLKQDQSDSIKVKNYHYQLELMSRIRKDFTLSEKQVKERFARYYPNLTDSMLRAWENTKQLEMRMIDGENRYFKRAVSNFFLLNKEAKAIKESIDGIPDNGVKSFQQRYLPEIFGKSTPLARTPFDSRKMKIDYSISLKPNQVPDGEIVRCWLPYPGIHAERQPKVEFLTASLEKYMIAPESQMQRTIYMEKVARKDSAITFHVSFIVETAAQWFHVDPIQAKPYDKQSELFKTYTAERPPQLVFNESITKLAKEIVGNETNPVEQVRKLYYWLNDNIRWAGALEYSIMECIPEYVLENKHGDCGMQTFLFLSMARSLGIPCKWQSGWYLMPEEVNMHDWAEVYYEGIGWVPVDTSFKLVDSTDKRIHEYFMNGLDSYRLIINDDYSKELFPPKKYPRSEPYDFQRGELEWSGGNLYFDCWSYDINVSYQ